MRCLHAQAHLIGDVILRMCGPAWESRCACLGPFYRPRPPPDPHPAAHPTPGTGNLLKEEEAAAASARAREVQRASQRPAKPQRVAAGPPAALRAQGGGGGPPARRSTAAMVAAAAAKLGVGQKYGPARHPQLNAVYVRRHYDHSANVIVRDNPLRPELSRLPAVVSAKHGHAVAQVRVRWCLPARSWRCSLICLRAIVRRGGERERACLNYSQNCTQRRHPTPHTSARSNTIHS